MIKQETIQEVIETAKVEEIIEDFVNLKRRGVNLIGLCPFHDEKTPSFTVSPSKNIYKCFGCGRGGDAITFIKEHEGFSYPEAIRYLARRYNIEIEEKEYSQEEKETIELKDSLYIVNEFASKYYEDKLFNTDEGKSVGLSYYKSRGFREATIKKFHLGYAANDRDGLTKSAIDKQFNIDHLRALGLTTKNDRDFFWSRVMFSIHNLSGKIIAFAGRTLSTDKKVPKYINSPESDIYNKRKTLYAMYFAKTHIRKADECILVEGYTDVISLHQSGIENVVASSGTSLTVDQIRLIKRYTQNVKVLYDGDTAGVMAAMRGLDLILEQDMNVRLVLLPEGEDPDSYLHKVGKDAFAKYLDEEAKDFVLFKTDLLLADAGDDPIRKAGILKDIVASIALIPDAIKRSLYTQQCAKMLSIDEELLTAEVNKVIKGNIKKKRLDIQRNQPRVNEDKWVQEKKVIGAQPTSAAQPPVNYREKDIVRILLTLGDKMYDEDKNVSVAQYLLINLGTIIDSFADPVYLKIIKEADQLIKDKGSFDVKYFIQHTDEKVKSATIDFLASPFSYANWEEKGIMLQTQKKPEDNFIKDSYQAILRFKLEKIKGLLTEVRDTINQLDSDSEEYKIAIKAMQQLLQERNNIAKELNTVILN
jgi:DNA primase